MGRKRQTRRDELLPEYVTRIPSKNRVVWREYLGKGKFGRVVTLKGNAGPLPADALHPATISPWLLHNKDGSQIKYEAFGSAWGRLMTKALKNGLAERFNFHDIKAKGQTDDEEGWSGHKSERMREIYERKARLKRATR